MKNRTKIILLAINSVLCAAIALCTYFLMEGWGTAVLAICYAAAAVGFVYGAVTFFLKKQALFKSGFVLVCFAFLIVVLIGAISRASGLNSYPNDSDKIDRVVQIIQNSGGWGYFVYFLIQILQVVILPLPAAVCYIPGTAIWGPLYATLIASAGVIVGSVIAYAIGKFVGKKAVVWVAGEEIVEKYTAYLSKRGRVLFVLMQILPFFPDDMLCMVAGLTGINFFFFLGVMVIVRPAVIAMYCYLGNGTLIPFSGWGIPVWIAIFAVCIVLAVLSFKYQDKFETWLVSKVFKRKKASNATAETENQQADIHQSVSECVTPEGSNEDKPQNEAEEAVSSEPAENKTD